VTKTKKQIGILNFAYGNGPFIRTCELALAFNDELERLGGQRIQFIVPWIYGDKQARIIREEFDKRLVPHPDELVLDPVLGEILSGIFYAHSGFSDYLKQWLENVDIASEKIKKHLSGSIKCRTLSNIPIRLHGENIVVELSRSPRVVFGVDCAGYYTSFGYTSQICKKAEEFGGERIDISRKLLTEASSAAAEVEKRYKIHAIAWPSTFSAQPDYKPLYSSEVMVPPITDLPEINTDPIEPGVFVTVSGIPGFEKLYKEAETFGLKIYCNDPASVPGSVKALPKIIPNKNIKFQFARSGWGSVWLSMYCGTPLVVPDFNSQDDPEIFFNNKTIERLGIGVVFKGQKLADLLGQVETINNNCRMVCGQIKSRWGTLDGNKICARIFAKDFYRCKIK